MEEFEMSTATSAGEPEEAQVNEYNPLTHRAIAKHHIRNAFAVVLLIICIVAVSSYYAGGDVTVVNGRAVVTVPSLENFKGLVTVKTRQGNVVETKVEPPAPPASNGKTSTTTDGIGAEKRMQRTEVETNRYDPIDKLTDAVSKTNESVKGLVGNVQELSGSVKKVDGRVDALGQKVDGIGTRVAALETKQTSPSPEVAPAPKAQLSVPGPQSSASASTKVASNVDNADAREVVAAVSAYKALGPAPNGKEINRHQIVQSTSEFKPCADGSQPHIVGKVHEDGYTHYRTKCD